MRAIFFSFIFLSGTFLLMAQTNDEVVKEQRNVNTFSELKISSGLEVVLLQGEKEAIVVETHKNVQEKVVVEQNNNVVSVSVKGNIRKADVLRVYVTVVNLQVFKLNAGCSLETPGRLKLNEVDMHFSAGCSGKMNLDVSKLKCDVTAGCDVDFEGIIVDLEMQVSAGSKVQVSGINGAVCNFDISSGSEVEAEGQTTGLLAEVTAGASLDAEKLIAQNAEVKAHSGAEMDVFVKVKLMAKAGGGGQINYSGNPGQTNFDIAASGTLKKK